jgi:PAS domain S-box-containing protein
MPRWRTFLRGSEGLEPRPAVRVGIGLILALGAVASKYLLDLIVGGDTGFVAYMTAVALSAWIGGLLGGLVTTAVCIVAHWLVFGTGGSGSLISATELVRAAIFALDGVLISLGSSTLRRYTYRANQDRIASVERYAAEREAHERAEQSRAALERLQTITASLAQASTPSDVARAVVGRGLAALGAAAGAVSLMTPDGKGLAPIALDGYPDDAAAVGRPYTLEGNSVLSNAVLDRRPVFIPNMADWRQRFPERPPAVLGEKHEEAALAVVPLTIGERLLGTLVFRFDEAHDFDDGSGELIVRLADQCAQALDRALAYDEQRNALRAAERSSARLAFLADASALLIGARDPLPELTAVAQLATERIGQWAAIELFDPDRPLLAIAHPSAEGEAALRRLASTARSSLSVLLAGERTSPEAVVIDSASPEMSQSAVGHPDSDLLSTLGTSGSLVAPIMRDRDWLGSIIVGRPTDGFEPEDAATLEDLARRIAVTLERSTLHDSVSRFKSTVDASLDAVFMFDPRTFDVTYVNRGARELVDAPDGLVGTSALELQPHVGREQLRATIQPLLSGEVPLMTYRGSIARRDGRLIPVEVLLQCVRQPDGSVIMVMVPRDISERIETQARLSRAASSERRRAAELNAILQAMQEGILVVDGAGAVQLANAAAEEICGGMPETLRQVAAMFGVRDSMLPSPDTRVDEQGIELPDGRWIEISCYPTGAAGLVESAEGGAILVLRDVTDSRESSRAQEAFMGVLSHELRTPVTSIYGYSKLLQRPGMRDNSMEIIADIEAESDRLYRIVEDLLALSRVQAGITVEGEPLLLQHLVEPLVHAELSRWALVKINLDIPGDLPTVSGERTYVEQVLRNLLSNAAKYGGPDSSIDVVARQAGREVEVRVLDRGSGIAAAEVDQLFRLFYRSASTARQASGAGIGLYVCRGLVRAMGGRIWAAPRPGGGSEFGFSLPLAEIDVERDESADDSLASAAFIPQ